MAVRLTGILYCLPATSLFREHTQTADCKNTKALFYGYRACLSPALGIESPEQLARDKMRGALFENFIVTGSLEAAV